ncbi:hypothetical protein LTR53_000126 [Teratosphaeriaceae sp. CCFEE 6253]|nr:hypothetical protein LTR53_000126 [Teratosphaeriaceae sp. CCFEE 6253]
MLHGNAEAEVVTYGEVTIGGAAKKARLSAKDGGAADRVQRKLERKIVKMQAVSGKSLGTADWIHLLGVFTGLLMEPLYHDRPNTSRMPASECHLLALPPELRNRIWIWVFGERVCWPIQITRKGHPNARPPPIVRTSKQIQNETLAMWCARTSLDLGLISNSDWERTDARVDPPLPPDFERGYRWLDELGSVASRHIRRFSFTAHIWRDHPGGLTFSRLRFDIEVAAGTAHEMTQIPGTLDGYERTLRAFRGGMNEVISRAQARKGGAGLDPREWRLLLVDIQAVMERFQWHDEDSDKYSTPSETESESGSSSESDSESGSEGGSETDSESESEDDDTEA